MRQDKGELNDAQQTLVGKVDTNYNHEAALLELSEALLGQHQLNKAVGLFHDEPKNTKENMRKAGKM